MIAHFLFSFSNDHASSHHYLICHITDAIANNIEHSLFLIARFLKINSLRFLIIKSLLVFIAHYLVLRGHYIYALLIFEQLISTDLCDLFYPKYHCFVFLAVWYLAHHVFQIKVHYVNRLLSLLGNLQRL